METNVGTPDRLVRLALGAAIALVGLAVLGGLIETASVIGVAAVIVGVVLVGTALTRTCLVYSLLGVDTCGRRS